MVVSTAACGPNSSGAVSLVPRFVHESVHHIRPTSVPTRGLALQVIQAARSSPELAMELNGCGALPASQSGATILDFGQNLAGGHHRRPTPRPTRRVGRKAQLGRTLHRRRAAYFDHHASNGPTEAINGRLEALRRNALGFRNLTHYRLRSLLHCGNLIQQIDAL